MYDFDARVSRFEGFGDPTQEYCDVVFWVKRRKNVQNRASDEACTTGPMEALDRVMEVLWIPVLTRRVWAPFQPDGAKVSNSKVSNFVVGTQGNTAIIIAPGFSSVL